MSAIKMTACPAGSCVIIQACINVRATHGEIKQKSVKKSNKINFHLNYINNFA